MTPQAVLRSIAYTDPLDAVHALLIERAAKIFAPGQLVPLLGDGDARLRNAAADVLVIAGDAAVPLLLEMSKESDSRGAIMAVHTLTRIATPAAGAAIAATLDAATDVNVLHAAIEGVALLSVTAARPRLRSLTSTDEWLSFAAANALEMLATE